jgi:hypothetical protein
MKAQDSLESNYRHRNSHPNFEKIIQAIREGQKWIWIEAEYGCRSSTITRYRKLLGLKAPKPKLTPDQRREIIELRKTKKLTEVAEIYGVTDKYVSSLFLKAHNNSRKA